LVCRSSHLPWNLKQYFFRVITFISFKKYNLIVENTADGFFEEKEKQERKKVNKKEIKMKKEKKKSKH